MKLAGLMLQGREHSSHVSHLSRRRRTWVTGVAVSALVFGLLNSALAFAEDPADARLPELKGEAKARIQNLEQHLQDWDVEGAQAELTALETLAPHDVEPVQYFRGRIAFEQGR